MTDAFWQAAEIDARPCVDLEQLSIGLRVARAVQVAHKIGVFDLLLAAPHDAPAIAAACDTQPGPTERLLVFLASTGLVFRQPDGCFRLTGEGRAAFDPDSPRYYGHGLAHQTAFWDRWHNLEQTLRQPPATGTGAPHMPPEIHRTFVMAMHDYSIRGRAQWLAGNVELTGRRHLLDLGGGPGTYCIALCQRFPELRATIFDLPNTEPLALANAARFGLRERIGFVGGDFDHDDLGSGYDCALVSNVLHGADHGSAARLRRVREVLPSGGLLVVQDFLLDDDRNGPLEAAMFHCHVGAYSVSEMLAAIAAAGFRDAALRGRGPAGNGLVTAVA